MRLLLTMAAALATSAIARGQAVDIRSITPSAGLSVPAGAFDLATGAASVTSTAAINATLRSNRNWNLTVRAGSSTFTHTPAPGAPSQSKSVSGLLIRENGTSSFLPLSTSSAVVTSGASGNNIPRSFDLRFDSSLSESPGDYSVTLIFTLVTL